MVSSPAGRAWPCWPACRAPSASRFGSLLIVRLPRAALAAFLMFLRAARRCFVVAMSPSRRPAAPQPHGGHCSPPRKTRSTDVAPVARPVGPSQGCFSPCSTASTTASCVSPSDFASALWSLTTSGAEVARQPDALDDRVGRHQRQHQHGADQALQRRARQQRQQHGQRRQPQPLRRRCAAPGSSSRRRDSRRSRRARSPAVAGDTVSASSTAGTVARMTPTTGMTSHRPARIASGTTAGTPSTDSTIAGEHGEQRRADRLPAHVGVDDLGDLLGGHRHALAVHARDVGDEPGVEALAVEQQVDRHDQREEHRHHARQRDGARAPAAA